MKKIVISTGMDFSLSPLAIKRYYELVHPEMKLFFYKENNNNGKRELVKINEVEPPPIEINILKVDIGDDVIDPHLQYKDYVYFEPMRDDPNLVQVVEELGIKANGRYSKLEIVQVDGKYRIHENEAGSEWIETPNDIIWQEA